MEHFELNPKEKWFVGFGQAAAGGGSPGEEGQYSTSGRLQLGGKDRLHAGSRQYQH